MDVNWTTIIVAIIGSIPAGIIAWHTHRAVNSRMDKFLERIDAGQTLAIDGAKAQATLDEKDAQRARTLAKGAP